LKKYKEVNKMEEYDMHSCEFKNEAECEEELENHDVTMEKAEEEKYGE
jgi:hypothetical protein